MSEPFVCQVAFVALSGKKLRKWYEQAFGFLCAGGTVFAGPLTTRVQGIPRVANVCRWLVDSKDLFQVEIFEYWSPKSKPRRPDWQACDIGYSRVGLHVADFDRAIRNLSALGARPLTEPLGSRGARRLCVRDPEGNLVELMEDDPLGGRGLPKARPEVPVAVRSVTLSVPDLGTARRTWTDAFGLAEVRGVKLHEPEHECLWGLPGADKDAVLLDGGGMLLELVEYRNPAGRPRPEGYRICDQGIMNVALGFRSKEDFDHAFARACNRGCRPNGAPLDIGVFKVMYVTDPEGFSVELLYPRPWAFRLTGFKPSPSWPWSRRASTWG
jgi:catechol 2,3-dioxygenase-like lactoylglutathione lyase family enzyme